MDHSRETDFLDEFNENLMPYQYEALIEHCSDSDCTDQDSSESSDSDVDEIAHPPVDEWCTCGFCVDMPTANERRCCCSTNIVDGKVEESNLKCITEHEGFLANCLNIHVMETSYYDYVLEQGALEEGQMIHEYDNIYFKLYCYLSYRRFTRWVYGLLGKRNRRVIPSCAVNAIRRRFPSEEYCGFQYPQ